MKCPHCQAEPLKVIGSALKNFNGVIDNSSMFISWPLSEYVIELFCGSCLTEIPPEILNGYEQYELMRGEKA